ncbi:HAD family hydrolase [Sphaerisporangium siamense]|uniref:Putative hydrolase of the HAD superfamily n=1 Tax=Sphaerisporangium siamense TaxID=795645 RepID=A0A7W7DCS7_9ACTN|nr:HAD family phosphatase [Sphaerisporangium siamense]MBB4704428.1 putative hydrolase of the HAD superfamily [Sphaerisporangium siamense]
MKWVLFDYGEVLSLSQPEADRTRMAEASGIDPDLFWRGYWEHRLEFDRGTLTPAAYWSEVLGRRVRDAEVELLVRLDIASWTHANEGAVAVLEEVRASGRRVALLSNAPVCVADGIERLPWITTMNARFYSGHLGLVKPDAEIYLRVAAELSARPSECVFIDDRLVNVSGAESAGMAAVHFRGADTLRDGLKAVLDGPATR